MSEYRNGIRDADSCNPCQHCTDELKRLEQVDQERTELVLRLARVMRLLEDVEHALGCRVKSFRDLNALLLSVRSELERHE